MPFRNTKPFYLLSKYYLNLNRAECAIKYFLFLKEGFLYHFTKIICIELITSHQNVLLFDEGVMSKGSETTVERFKK